MGEVHYMISEAAKRVNVETHVLRYWEEELELSIGRTEMGHRYYTEEDVQLFNCIKELKEQGILLKELKNLIPDILRAKNKARAKKEFSEETSTTAEDQMLTPLQKALLENNKLLENSISLAVSKAVITEMDFLLQAKDRQEEERYKKLDNLIRQQQVFRKEVARSTTLRNLLRIFEG
jgi:DNA-binding transcriptional MerR regulator